MKGDSAGSARLAAADERTNRALVDAVERHATKDPGARGMLKRASGAYHFESELQKNVALDTEQNLAPHTPEDAADGFGFGGVVTLPPPPNSNPPKFVEK